ncbi:peroxisomal coenzyme A diphosphatase NUDT7 [Chanos chanos]|uniref:Peroxisomal coenzyme A diphosphatase NUDT7 n=1 Tax=Chanos chanos TaxID=29144 RepID=A0A6J2UTG3_CHACN|nr:peroxisomal coenzyme A diphosphatase NUDT7 [Chanos chanos]
MDVKEKAIAALKHYEIGDKFSYLPTLPKASVLIPLFVKDGELRVLMTVRSMQLRSNAGEVCFPGGKFDPQDRDEVDTALREAQEEVGLPPDRVEVVCRLFPIMNKRGIVVTPVVGFIEDTFCPCPNPDEVSDVFSVPLEFFTQKTHHSCYDLSAGVGLIHSFLYTDPVSGKVQQIWGLTAILAILVAALALEKPPEFDTGFNITDPMPHFRHNLDLRISKL